MKFQKWIAFLVCFCLLTAEMSPAVNAWSADGHNKKMAQVLFGETEYKDYKSSKDKTVKDALKALEYASYLTIDQFNNYGKKKYNFLKDTVKVRNLPDFDQTDYKASGKAHRSKTHRGWDFHYDDKSGDMERWEKRKLILLNTAETIFSFGNEKQKNSFCALIYYIHILGDHMADKSLKTRSHNGLKIEVGGKNDHNTIIDELIKHFEILFKSQKKKTDYLTLIRDLKKADANLKEIVSYNGGIDSDEKLQELQKYTDEILDSMVLHVPRLLQNEDFFKEVFYSDTEKPSGFFEKIGSWFTDLFS